MAIEMKSWDVTVSERGLSVAQRWREKGADPATAMTEAWSGRRGKLAMWYRQVPGPCTTAAEDQHQQTDQEGRIHHWVANWTPMEAVVEKKTLNKLISVVDNPDHHLHPLLNRQRSSFSNRSLQLRRHKDGYRNYFLPRNNANIYFPCTLLVLRNLVAHFSWLHASWA